MNINFIQILLLRSGKRRYRIWLIISVIALLQSNAIVAYATPEHVPEDKLGRSEYCGLCHTDIYQQWNASAHHFSSFNNPIYRKVILSTVGVSNTEVLSFCAGCHDPILKSAGKLAPLKINSWAANSGITCLSCHRITEANDRNGEYTISEPLLHPFALAENPTLQKAHELLLELTPWLHKRVLSKPLYKEPEYCASCHTLDVPASINGHADFPLLTEFQQWRNSPFHISAQNHGGGKRCHDCHMPEVPSNDPAAKDGLIRSHRFAAGNTALPAFNRDIEQLQEAERFLSSGIVELEIVGIRRNADSMFQPLHKVTILPGDDIELKIAVQNKAVGHHFPAATVDSNEAWLSLVGKSASGEIVFKYGVLDARESLPLNTIRFGAKFIDKHGNITDRRSTTTRAVAIKAQRLIPSGKTITVTMKTNVPQSTILPLQLELRLNWRKYDPQFIDWVFDGRPTPALPITTIAKVRARIPTKPEVAINTSN